MKRLLACLLLALLAACSKGPDTEKLHNDIAAQLADVIPQNQLEIAHLERRGSQNDPSAPSGETRRIIYFDADLQLNEDLDLGAWDSPGISALVSSLGTGPRGISGVTSGGNNAGDIIQAHGTAVYRQEGKQWQMVAPVGYRPADTSGGPVHDSVDGAGATLGSLRTILDVFPPETSPVQNRIIQDELLMARRHIEARLARSARGYAIAAGTEHGQYLRIARALFPPEMRTLALITRGAEENLHLLRNGTVTLALVQGDAAWDAYEGEGAFSGHGPNHTLRSIGSLYPEPIHVLVAADSPLQSIADLRGKRVAIGELGAASRTTAVRVLEAHGLELADIQALELSIGGALNALAQGQADAVMQVIGTPADNIRELLINTPVRLLPLNKPTVNQLSEDHPGYFSYTIPRGTYPRQTSNIDTIATAAMLLTDTTFSDAEVDRLTRQVFARGRDYSGLGSAQAVRISPATSAVGLSVPLHPAAARALEDLYTKQ